MDNKGYAKRNISVTANECPTPPKKRRLVFDGVEVPTLRSLSPTTPEFEGRIKSELSEEEIRKKLDALKNHDVKQKKADHDFLLDTVHSRLSIIGYDIYDISMPAHALAATFSRDYLKDTYGGSTIKTFPEIAQKHFNRHGLRDFMFLNLDFNPFAPQIPGSPGLFFECETNITRRRVQRVFTRLAVNEWQPEGFYDVIPCLSLTKVEWQAQKPAVRSTWHTNIYKHTYGRNVRARITLRKQLGREAKATEVEEALQDKDNKFKTISVDDIARAYDSGDEAIAVWCMKCVGYDEEFQQSNIDGFAAWKIKKAEEARNSVLNPVEDKPKKRKSKKRRDIIKIESPNNSAVSVDIDVLIPRGTRSRPSRSVRISA